MGLGEGINQVILLFLFRPFFNLSLRGGRLIFWVLPTQGKKEFDATTGAISLQNNPNLRNSYKKEGGEGYSSIGCLFYL